MVIKSDILNERIKMVINIDIKMKLNKEWYLTHPMPKSPTEEQHIAWNIEYAKSCACRAIPAKLNELNQIINIKYRQT